MEPAKGTLYVVATPIGNLEDITLRALRVLREVDYMLAEDTRVTGKLLAHHRITQTLRRYDAHASGARHETILKDLAAGKQIALVSDAGTPGVSDPGVLLVQQARAQGTRLETVPGASSLTAALSIAGSVGNQFTFLGFVPTKKGRETFFANLGTHIQPVIFFESTHRIVKTLEALNALVSDYSSTAQTVTVTLCRELTKLHEEVLVGTPAEVLSVITSVPVKQKGEFVVIVSIGG